MSVLPTITHNKYFYKEKAVFYTPLIHRFTDLYTYPQHVVLTAVDDTLLFIGRGLVSDRLESLEFACYGQ